MERVSGHAVFIFLWSTSNGGIKFTDHADLVTTAMTPSSGSVVVSVVRSRLDTYKCATRLKFKARQSRHGSDCLVKNCSRL